MARNSEHDLRLVAVGVLLLVGGLGFLLDRTLVIEGASRTLALVVTNGLTGAIAAALFYRYAAEQQRERAALQERLQVISDMNHHVRNALQVIAFYGETQHGESMQMIKDSIQRIEWTLREVLPRSLAPLSPDSPLDRELPPPQA